MYASSGNLLAGDRDVRSVEGGSVSDDDSRGEEPSTTFISLSGN